MVLHKKHVFTFSKYFCHIFYFFHLCIMEVNRLKNTFLSGLIYIKKCKIKGKKHHLNSSSNVFIAAFFCQTMYCVCMCILWRSLCFLPLNLITNQDNTNFSLFLRAHRFCFCSVFYLHFIVTHKET